ncbi:MAG TPA: cyclophilin-like fold protein [Jiangellaceae bacterium]|jgi:hypothetical protein|nr:cyclophilin-like fold protein [Jiangellaceae bacterium]
MDIRHVIDGIQTRGTLEDTPSALDLADLLPLTLSRSDFHSSERIADLPRALTTSEAPAGTAAQAGDIAYYAPWENLTLFYRDSPYASGLIRLSRLDAQSVQLLAGLGRTPPQALS